MISRFSRHGPASVKVLNLCSRCFRTYATGSSTSKHDNRPSKQRNRRSWPSCRSSLTSGQEVQVSTCRKSGSNVICSHIIISSMYRTSPSLSIQIIVLSQQREHQMLRTCNSHKCRQLRVPSGVADKLVCAGQKILNVNTQFTHH